ncbi:MAG: tetratricopeptide repeat protein [Actinobacteria bacterium]|nr:MAG: tetratricopeptide repeat protein [Actinomycetota bacterium]
MDPDSLAHLEEEREFLLRSLRDLEREREAGDIEDGDYRTLRDDYTARTASVALAIDEGRAQLPPPPARNARRLVATVVAVAVVALGAGVLVARASGERVAGRPGSGSLPTGDTEQLAQARVALNEGNVVEAVKTYDRVLKTNPRNPEALAYRGWILRLAAVSGGAFDQKLWQQGLASIERAIAVDPSYPDAHFFRGLILYRDRHDATGAAAELQKFLGLNPPPDMVAPVRQLLGEVTATVAAGSGP